jgi:thiol:disulfide interchange protein DsbD
LKSNLVRSLIVLLGAWLCGGQAWGQAEPVKLSLEKPQSVKPGDKVKLTVTLRIAPGFHIQSNKPAPNFIPTAVRIEAPKGVRAGTPSFPPATMEQAAGMTIPVFSGEVRVTVPVEVDANVSGAQTLKVSVGYQACDEGSCYPPAEAVGQVQLSVGQAASAPRPPAATSTQTSEGEASGNGPSGKAEPSAPANGSVSRSEPATPNPPPSEAAQVEMPTGATSPTTTQTSFPGYSVSKVTEFVGPEEFRRFLDTGKLARADAGTVSSLLQSGNLLVALPLIFLLGLALNLTPCVYPIIPITISYFGSQARADGRKPFALAVFYVLGMALMYSALGVVAGLTGGLFGAQLQNPWVLTAFALVMFGLALSQFDRKDGRPIWEFQLPGALRNSAQSRSGIAGALLMGLMVGVVAAPCIGPAVIALLQWVGTQRDPVLGFAVFFTLAVGLGLPYLLLAMASGSMKAMPRAGEWMMGVKHIFGAVLVWMGAYYLQTPLALMNPTAPRAALVTVTALIAVYLIFVDRAGNSARLFSIVRRGIGIGAAALAVYLLSPAPAETIRWEPYSDQALEAAMRDRRPVLIDFTAAWCAACKELEHKTFSDPTVGRASQRFVALRADMTNFGGPEAKRWQERYGIKGLPTIVRLEPN